MCSLDDLKHIKQLDAELMVSNTLSFASQLENSLKMMSRFNLSPDFPIPDKVIIAGTGGGSGFIGCLIKELFSFDYPFSIQVIQGYRLPLWANSNTLVFCLSYSGNTQEILSCFEKAHENNVSIIGISKGGTLGELLKQHNYPYVQLPDSTMQARSAIGNLFIPIVWILERLGLIGSRPRHEIIESIPFIQIKNQGFSPENLLENNLAKQLAQAINQKLPILYCMDVYHSAIALRWKNQLSENSKILAHYNTIPSMHHDEIVGWEWQAPLMKYIQPILFRDSKFETRELNKRLNFSRELLENYFNQHVIEIHAEGQSLIERLFYLTLLGDWVSIYLAFLNQIDPTPVHSIQKLKALLV